MLLRNKNRTKAASLNAFSSLITQLISLILKFGIQTVFIHEMSQDFLGLNGLFSNVVSFLSFADLGIGTAITVSLYRPIANKDFPLIRALLRLYKKAYLLISVLMGIAAIIVSPFIIYLIKDSEFSSFQVGSWFLLYFGGTIATYLAAWKRSLIIAEQDGYLSTLNDFVFKSIQQVFQIISIVLFHSFLLFLLIQLLVMILSNAQLSSMANRHYPQEVTLADDDRVEVPKNTREIIKKNIVGAVSGKLGSIVVFATDNIVLSMFVGLKTVAQYSNYMLIIQSLNSVFSQVVSSVVASIGNLAATKSSVQQQNVLYKLLFINSGVNVFLISGLSIAISPFINLWAGKNYVISSSIVFLILLNFLINQYRLTAQNFISGLGLYWPLRWKSLIEATINLVASVYLTGFLHASIFGVVLGTLLSNVVINIVWEPMIVYRVGLKISSKGYFIRYGFHLLYSIIVLVAGMSINLILPEPTFLILVDRLILFEILSIGIFCILNCKTMEYKYVYKLMMNQLSNMIQKK